MFSLKKIGWCGLMMLSIAVAKADVVLPKILGHNMVLQREKPVPIWGTATPGEHVTVTFAKQNKSAIADTAGKWQIFLDPMKASEKPQTLTIKGNNTIVLNNILVGEVWLCSGQSNMQYEMRKNSKVKKPDTSTANSPVDELHYAHSPMIRLFLVTQKNLRKPDSLHQGWDPATDTIALKNFSAVGYFYAKNLYAKLHVPIGMISSAVSGSRIEPWTPREGYDHVPYFAENNYKVEGEPGKFFHPMIEAVSPFALKGFLWYQGETNCFMNETLSYTNKMQVLINSWRKAWGDKNLPFYFVQIANHYYSKGTKPVVCDANTLPQFREAQTAALQIPNTGMIITTDLNDDVANIHPPFKWEVGRRLALVAEAKTYGDKKLEYSGPVYKKMNVNGDRVVLQFDHIGEGLVSQDSKPLTWFTIAGADGKFVQAQAEIKGDKVIVSSPEVKSPVAVRFSWDETAQSNFYNKDGLPAAPFRTDNTLKFIPVPQW